MRTLILLTILATLAAFALKEPDQSALDYAREVGADVCDDLSSVIGNCADDKRDSEQREDSSPVLGLVGVDNPVNTAPPTRDQRLAKLADEAGRLMEFGAAESPPKPEMGAAPPVHPRPTLPETAVVDTPKVDRRELPPLEAPFGWDGGLPPLDLLPPLAQSPDIPDVEVATVKALPDLVVNDAPGSETRLGAGELEAVYEDASRLLAEIP